MARRVAGRLAEERHRLTSNLYFCAELVMMIERAGFSEVEARGESNDLAPTADDSSLVQVRPVVLSRHLQPERRPRRGDG